MKRSPLHHSPQSVAVAREVMREERGEASRVPRAAIDVEVDPGARRACMTVVGPLTAAAIREMLAVLIQHPEWRPGFVILADMRAAPAVFSSEDLVQLAKTFAAEKQRLGSGRIAIVVKTAVDFGMARMWDAMTDQSRAGEANVFRSLEAAERWLG